MKKVCYIFGAGFSAHAQLPVMSNFIDKAKDIYFSAEQYIYKDEIKKTLDLVRDYAIIKESMNSDLSNIEELLSIADMKRYTSSGRDGRNIKSFIKSVIAHYENALFEGCQLNKFYRNFHVDGNEVLQGYVNFVCSLFQLDVDVSDSPLSKNDVTLKTHHARPDKQVEYGIVTFNYDTILERCVELVNEVNQADKLSFSRTGISDETIRYCKLHGSLDNDSVIPPTWAKELQGPVKKDWIDAYTLISGANEIRIIGFSFPNTDSHISYLFKSAIMENENLKRIDVLCLDSPDRFVESKYRQHFITKKFHFVDGDIRNYFSGIRTNNNKFGLRYDLLESAHEAIFRD